MPFPLFNRFRASALTGIFLVLFGLILLTGGAGFFIYRWQAHSNLDSLVVAPTDEVSGEEHGGLVDKRKEPDFPGAADGDRPMAFSLQSVTSQSLFPGEVLNPALWTDPLSGSALIQVENPLLEGFSPVSPDTIAPLNSLLPPGKISIPAIDLQSEVQGLQILDLGNSKAYETPKNVVGHIPETASGGENGTSWFFGHLESPIRGEGSVFSRLPEIPRMLRQGIAVYATVDNGDHVYLYRLTASEVVHQDDLALHEKGGASISLVTCVPRLVYDYRLIVSGELVGSRLSDKPADL